MMQECVLVTLAITEALKRWTGLKGGGARLISAVVTLVVCVLKSLTAEEFEVANCAWLFMGTFLGANGLYLLGKNMFTRASTRGKV